MVTLLTNYNTQRYILNSTDDIDNINFHNGDQVLLMDQDALIVFDEENVAWHAVPAGRGGGGYEANDWFDYTKPAGAITTDKTFSYNSWTPIKGHTGITGVTLTATVSIPDSFADGCTSLVDFHAPLAKTLYATSLRNTAIEYLVLPSLTSMNGANICSACTALKGVDFGGPAASDGLKGTYIFSSCSIFDTLILRGSNVWALQNVNSFNGSKFASGQSGGTLYVPFALIASYQAATNWSTILGYANNQIKAIEGSIYETAYVDGTPIS